MNEGAEEIQPFVFGMKKIIFLLLVCSSSVLAQTDSDSSIVFFKQSIAFLASDSLEGRLPGTEEIETALAYIRKTMGQGAGLKTKVQKFSYQLDGAVIDAANCFALLNNRQDSTIIIGAHYDHIGWGGPLSKNIGMEAIHNGADDNASGVAMALRLASQPELRKAKYNFLFVFYSGHESGLFGSEHFAAHFLPKKKPFKHVKAVINFDMIGRLSPIGKELYCAYTNYQGELPTAENLKIKPADPSVLERLDTKHFLALKVPTFNFSTGMHLDYHKVSDDAQYINYDGMEKTLDYLIRFLQQF